MKGLSHNMKPYNHKEIEGKWQAVWEASGIYRAEENSPKPKKYILDMFPYPSGDGLHVGHVENYTATCIYSRYMRMKGFNVLHPIGWDAFGLPAENYAIKTGTHPDVSTHKNIENFIKQLKALGVSYDWSREIDTSSPEYYKWTQWFFLLLYKNGLAYKKKAKVNWCDSCQTVLANEQASGGVCERCKNEVRQKDLEQWFFKITDYAEDLIDGLSEVDWPHGTVALQRNWIGKSEGVEFSMKIENSSESISVYTTRIDTVFGMTYVVLAPEHPLIAKLAGLIKNSVDVESYVRATEKKTELERTELAKDKTGVILEGVTAVNPFTGKAVPVYIGDYVLSNYGTGAVMAVPAHDERDFEFAKKYNLSIITTVEPVTGLVRENEEFRRSIVALVEDSETGKVLSLNWGEKLGGHLLIGGGLEEGEDVVATALREIAEETGYTDLKFVGQSEHVHHHYFAASKNVYREIDAVGLHFILKSGTREALSLEANEVGKFTVEWLSKKDAQSRIQDPLHAYILEKFLFNKVATGDGILVNSGEFSGLDSVTARTKMGEWLEGKKLGTRKTNYRLRDWLVSRQRYWGSPIPIIYCDDCGEVPVPEKDLPVLLPTDIDFRPTGESPLAYSKSFADVVCPKCNKKARREYDTMDTFVCSSWYYLRFADPKNTEMFASPEALAKWLPVDAYMGGAEHTVLHLMYARFFTKVLKKLGFVDFNEPFQKLRHQGMILASDGRKMSKSLGNVVGPNDIIETFGADTLRLHEMFLGPLEDMKVWNSETIIGPRRFLERVWRLAEKISDSADEKKVETSLHKTIKKVGDDIEVFGFNTAISALMILVNDLEKLQNISRAHYETLLILLAPLAPHITEELWHELGNTTSIHLAQWPVYDAAKCIAREAVIAIQVNGKVRDTITVSPEATEDEVKAIVMEREIIKKWLDGKEVKKVIFVPGKLLSLVVGE